MTDDLLRRNCETVSICTQKHRQRRDDADLVATSGNTRLGLRRATDFNKKLVLQYIGLMRACTECCIHT